MSRSLDQRSPTDRGVCVCVCDRNLVNEEVLSHWGLLRQKKKKEEEGEEEEKD